MNTEKQYRITWYTDVWDTDPLAAARQALAIQRDVESVATVFTVRDAVTGKAYWLNSHTMRRSPMADRETPAIKRVNTVCKALGVHWFHQTDPRGCAVYISTEQLTDSNYTRGVAVCD